MRPPAPYPHQIAGEKQLHVLLDNNRRGLLLDECGLGKTKQAIDVAQKYLERGDVRRVVVICPHTLPENWRREILLNAGAEATIIEGTKAKRRKLLQEATTGWVVLHYEIARTLPEEVSALADQQFLIADEAHALKNVKAKVTKAFQQLTPRFGILMTGTPLANRPEDAFTLIDWVSHGKIYKSQWSFQKEHLRTVEIKIPNKRTKWGKPLTFKKIIGYRNLEKLNRILSAYGIRRRLAEVIDMPDVVIAPRYVKLADAQAEKYEQMKTEFKVYVDAKSAEGTLTAPNVLAQLTRLYQILSGFLQLEPGDSDLIEWIGSAKLDALREILEEIDGEKAVVWCRFRPTMARLEEEFKDLHPAVVHGGISDRQAEVDKFNDDPSCRLFLGQLQSAHQGINLEKACHYAIFYERMFSPLNNEQALDRIRRIGQTHRQVVIPIIVEHTLDDKLTELLEQKGVWRKTVLGIAETVRQLLG